MVNSVNEEIVISSHFEESLLVSLFEKYLMDDFTMDTFPNKIIHKPRRFVGNYLFFQVHDGAETHSVMVKKGKTSSSVQCDCIDYTNTGKCNHIKEVLISIKNIVEHEQSRAMMQNQFLEDQRLKMEEQKLKMEEQKFHKMKIIEELKKKIHHTGHNVKPQNFTFSRGDGSKNKPFMIQDARDFSYHKVKKAIPILDELPRRIKTIKPIYLETKGIDVWHKFGNEKKKVTFIVNGNNDIEIQCSCKETYENNMCLHALECTNFIADYYSKSLFTNYLNYDIEKNKLLSEYGLSLNDPEAQKFSFAIDFQGNLKIDQTPINFVHKNKLDKIYNLISNENRNNRFRTKLGTYEVGLLFQFEALGYQNMPLRLEATKIESGVRVDAKHSRIVIHKTENLPLLNVLEKKQYDILHEFSFVHFKEHIAQGYYTSNYQIFSSQYNETAKQTYSKYFSSKIEEHWSELCKWRDIKYLKDNENFSKSNIKSLQLHSEKVFAELKIDDTEKFIILKATFHDEEGLEIISADQDIEIYLGKLILLNDVLYLIGSNNFKELLEMMPGGTLFFPKTMGDRITKDILLPLSEKYGVEIPESLISTVKVIEMEALVYLKEFNDKFLQIYPKFKYGDLELDMMDIGNHFVEEDGKRQLIARNKNDEHSFVLFIKASHELFKNQSFQDFFMLPYDAVMKSHWFIQFTRMLQEQSIKLLGFQELKKFKYNNTKPTWEMNFSSGIDWFDVQITASWGDQTVSFKELRKAITGGQNFVVLGDGSFGMLPEEWIEKYTTLFKFGTEEKTGIRISKKQFNIVEMLFDQIDSDEVKAEINDKKSKLLNIEKIKTTAIIPSNIQATLRPYQKTGFQWMQVLDEISWGGCLADDMGLGKTLQTITFLSYIKTKYNNPTSLIICPTSLIYNWENELNKFAPELKYHLFYGTDRIFTNDHFEDYDIIISSYGVVRNDIERLRDFTWEYVILDESQAIKNPDAITTKAVQLLKTRNRLILSGTPLQNNTYDIYAQFNFLNPGMLGGREFFRSEFATQIDKEGDKRASEMLRRLIKPFMLRRTKNEVATDLPEKTETILWCQMDKTQKAIYDEYKDYYRHALIQKIEKEGMAKSGVYILEGLLRLRQICDDPRLIKDSEIKPTMGVKIKELVREIQENMGEHKMLVFSQFTEMLALIRTEMDTHKIKYCYLDGGTPAQQRKEQVEKFQDNKEINVFLISLKAGGVGLNLTEADYVYIVDPWWNPAVEQQAIDRTHRIGQKNKIFAYKMICKDSVEEKIMLLQERKKTLSKEIVQEDTAFFKALTMDDVSYLFS